MRQSTNFGGKIPTVSGFIKKFNNNSTYYPLKNGYTLSNNQFIKSYSPYPSIGNYIKNFNVSN